MVVLTVTFIGFAAAAAAAAPAAPGAALALVEVLVLTIVVIPSAVCEVVLVPVVDVTMVLWLTEVPLLLTVVVSKITCMMAVLLTLVHCHMPEASERLGGGVEVAGKGSPYGVGVGPKAEK